MVRYKNLIKVTKDLQTVYRNIPSILSNKGSQYHSLEFKDILNQTLKEQIRFLVLKITEKKIADMAISDLSKDEEKFSIFIDNMVNECIAKTNKSLKAMRNPMEKTKIPRLKQNIKVRSFCTKAKPNISFNKQSDICFKYPDGKAKNINTTKLSWVDTKEQLAKLIQKLKQEKEIAIDVENHDKFSYHGFSCLVQISTKEEDFVIDCIKLRPEMQILNNVTKDPLILKVFHDPSSDILWLQRDFGVFVINCFDTCTAAKALGFPKVGLEFLLQEFCSVKKMKQYQRSDWRKRPLTEEMLLYARTDTHYLLYIKDRLTNLLLEKNKNLLEDVVKSSNDLCSRKYKKTNFEDHGYITKSWKKLKLRNTHKNEKLFFIYRSLYLWREEKAKANDVSGFIILSKRLIEAILSRSPTDLSSMKDIFKNEKGFTEGKQEDIYKVFSDASKAYEAYLEKKTTRLKSKTEVISIEDNEKNNTDIDNKKNSDLDSEREIEVIDISSDQTQKSQSFPIPKQKPAIYVVDKVDNNKDEVVYISDDDSDHDKSQSKTKQACSSKTVSIEQNSKNANTNVLTSKRVQVDESHSSPHDFISFAEIDFRGKLLTRTSDDSREKVNAEKKQIETDSKDGSAKTQKSHEAGNRTWTEETRKEKANRKIKEKELENINNKEQKSEVEKNKDFDSNKKPLLVQTREEIFKDYEAIQSVVSDKQKISFLKKRKQKGVFNENVDLAEAKKQKKDASFFEA